MNVNLDSRNAAVISQRMSEVASKHKSDVIANAYASVSVKLEALHGPFSPRLDGTDMRVIATFVANYMRS